MADIKLHSERTTLRTILGTLVMGALGVSLLYFAAKDQWWSGYESWQIVARNIGSLCVVSVAITFLWELFGKRAFRDELLAKAGLSQEIRTAGLTKITDSFLRDLDWEPLFRTVSKLDIFFAYGQTWRNTHWEKLVAAASRGIRVRVVLPDPEHDATVTELAKRFNYTKDRVVELIKGAEKEFSQLGSKSSGAGTTVDIWYLPAAPLLTFYRFDFKAVIALYTHRTERVPVPAFVVESPGTLYNFVRQEFDAMIDQKSGMAKCITRK